MAIAAFALYLLFTASSSHAVEGGLAPISAPTPKAQYIFTGFDGNTQHLSGEALSMSPAVSLWSDCAHALNAAYAVDTETQQTVIQSLGFKFSDGTNVAVHIVNGSVDAEAVGYSVLLNSERADVDKFSTMRVRPDSGVLDVFYRKRGEFGPSVTISTPWLRFTIFRSKEQNSLRVMTEVLLVDAVGAAHGLLGQTLSSGGSVWTEESFGVGGLLDTDFEFARFGSCNDVTWDAGRVVAFAAKGNTVDEALAKQAPPTDQQVLLRMGLSSVLLHRPAENAPAGHVEQDSTDSATVIEKHSVGFLVPDHKVTRKIGKSTIRPDNQVKLSHAKAKSS